jgi:hypothetical protein
MINKIILHNTKKNYYYILPIGHRIPTFFKYPPVTLRGHAGNIFLRYLLQFIIRHNLDELKYQDDYAYNDINVSTFCRSVNSMIRAPSGGQGGRGKFSINNQL